MLEHEWLSSLLLLYTNGRYSTFLILSDELYKSHFVLTVDSLFSKIPVIELYSRYFLFAS